MLANHSSFYFFDPSSLSVVAGGASALDRPSLHIHNLEEAESLCRHIAIIDQGKIIEQSSVKSLLAKLHKETLILDLRSPIDPLKLPTISGFDLNLIDDSTLEVNFYRECELNTLFSELSKVGCIVTSLRNKANRLEELFLNSDNIASFSFCMLIIINN